MASNSFQVNQDDLTPMDQNLSISTWKVISVYLTAYGAGSGLQITARDQGNYSSAPFRTTAKVLTEPYNRPINVSYAFIHVSNFVISAFNSPSEIITSLAPWTPARNSLFFLRLGVTGSGSSPFFITYHYTPSSSQSMIELHARGLSLPGPNNTTVNLTGNAVVEMTSFSEATVGLWEYSQMLPFLINAHMKFPVAAVKIWNATGYLIDQAGKTDTPTGSTLDFGRPFSFQLNILFPAIAQGSIMTVGISSVAAYLVDTPRGGGRLVPEQQTVEDPVVQFARLTAAGIASFASGVFGSIAFTRRRGRLRPGT